MKPGHKAINAIYEKGEAAMKVVKSRIEPETFAIHYHNAVLRKDEKLAYIEPEQPLYKLMKKHCPVPFKSVVVPNIGKKWLES